MICWTRSTFEAKQATITLRWPDTGDLGVGGVAEEKIDAGIAESRHPRQVGGPSVGGKLVEFDIAGVQHRSGPGVDGDRQRIGDRVVDGEVLALEYSVRTALPLSHFDELRFDPVFTALRGNQGEGELGTDDRDVAAQLQQKRDRADMVLVRVGEYQRLDLVQPIFDMADIRQDQIDARLVVAGEQHSAVDDQQPAQVLENRHVAADFADTAERGDAQRACGQRRGREHRLGHRSTAAARISVVSSSS